MNGRLTAVGGLAGTIIPIATLSGRLSGGAGISGEITVPQTVGAETYTGSMLFTPTQEVQTIEIDHKMAMADIIIEAIPSNYGLITWNGSTITVS